MKSSLIILTFCFAGLHADHPDNMKSCLMEYGIKSTDIGTFRELGKPNSDVLKNYSEEKMACAIACAFNKDKKKKESIYNYLTYIINKDLDDQYSEDERKEMLETVKHCNTKTAGDDCKFLHCIEVTKSPFANIILTVSADDTKKNQGKKFYM